MDTDKIKIYGAQAKVSSFQSIAEIEAAERAHQKAKIDKILALQPDVFINRQLIYDYQLSLMVQQGVTVIEHADFEGIERLAKALGSEIMSTFDSPGVMGGCQLIEEILIGEDIATRFSGCNQSAACSIVLRGSSVHILDEAERSLHDAICILNAMMRNRTIIWGGGHSEILMAEAVDQEVRITEGKEALAMECFARALRTIPATICDNAGLDSASLLAKLRSDLQRNPGAPKGIDVENRCVGDMQELGITECIAVKEQALNSAAEATEQILRVDQLIRNEPRKREKMRR